MNGDLWCCGFGLCDFKISAWSNSATLVTARCLGDRYFALVAWRGFQHGDAVMAAAGGLPSTIWLVSKVRKSWLGMVGDR